MRKLRPATIEDARLLWHWRNDPVTRHNSFNTDVVPWDGHLDWLTQRLQDPDCLIWIMEADDISVGTVRYSREGHRAEASYTVAPEHRGQGHGSALLRLSPALACDYWNIEYLYGITSSTNLASVRAFEVASWCWLKTYEHRGTWCHWFDWGEEKS